MRRSLAPRCRDDGATFERSVQREKARGRDAPAVDARPRKHCLIAVRFFDLPATADFYRSDTDIDMLGEKSADSTNQPRAFLMRRSVQNAARKQMQQRIVQCARYHRRYRRAAHFAVPQTLLSMSPSRR